MNITQEQKHLERLLKNGNVEIRCIDKVSKLYKSKPGAKRRPVIWSGVYSDYKSMRVALIFAERSGFDVYNTINPVKIPATNDDLKPFKRTAKDSDISRLNTIFFDFDPVRGVGEAATPYQVGLAVGLAELLADYLTDLGWMIPVIGFSGNGAHLLYHVDLDIEHSKSLKGLYAGLSKRFSTDTIDFDVTVRNLARIGRCYGSTNRKASRRSSCAASNEITHSDTILRAIELLTPPKAKATWVRPENEQKAGKFIKNWDIVGAFNSASLYLDQAQDSGKHFVTCPWSANHSFTAPKDTVIWEGEWPQFNCSHNSCANRTIQDAIEILGGAK